MAIVNTKVYKHFLNTIIDGSIYTIDKDCLPEGFEEEDPLWKEDYLRAFVNLKENQTDT